MSGSDSPRTHVCSLPKHAVTVALAVALLTVGSAPSSGVSGHRPPALAETLLAAPQSRGPSPGKPNIVFVLADDFSLNLVQYMPNLLAMQKEGTTFSNYFVTDSLCCPSRSSIFTGRFPHNTRVFLNQGPLGGYGAFNNHGNAERSFAVSLHGGGYKAAMLGKYLNGYGPAKDQASPGWTEWDVAGLGYNEFNYTVNENGRLVHYGRTEKDYLTDVVSDLGDGFIRRAAPGPFFIEIATFAPHAPYTPAPRDASKFPGLQAPRTPAFALRADAASPKYLKDIAPLAPADIAAIDRDFRMRVQSVQAIDKMIGRLRATLAGLRADNTYLVFSSDNGYHMGEHSLRPGKMTAFDTDIHVPLVVVGPGVPKGRTVDALAENVDLNPTFADLGGVLPVSPDGHSLAAFLRGETVDNWRESVLVEHRRPVADTTDPDLPQPHAGNPATYEAIRTSTALYVEYQNGETEYYDLTKDPDELRNTATALSADLWNRFHDMLARTKACVGADACWAAQHFPK